MANNNDRSRGRGSNTGYAPILQGKSSEFIGSPAFREVVRNLFEIQYEKRSDEGNGEFIRHSKNKVRHKRIYTFPPYNKSKSDANEWAIRWAHNDDVDEYATKLFAYHGSMYLVEKNSESDLGYRIIRKLSSKQYQEFIRDRNAGYDEQISKGSNMQIHEQDRSVHSYIGGKLGASVLLDEYEREVGQVYDLDENQNRQGNIQHYRNRNDKYGQQDRQDGQGNKLYSEPGSGPDGAGEDVRHFKNGINDLGSTEQLRVMWTLEEGVLNDREVASFYTKVSEMKKQKYHNYKMSKDGEYIFEIENKLVYFDGDYDYPEITKVIVINSDKNDIINQGKDWIYDGEEFGWSISDAIEIAEISLGQGVIQESNFENSRAFEREISRGAGKDGTKLDSRSGEDVKLSKNGGTVIDEDIEPPIEVTSEEINANAFELRKEIQAKLDKHIEKYGELEKGVNPVRKVNLPKNTGDDRYVRRGTRTVIESERVTNEIAEKLTEEIANGEFWTAYERAGNKKAQDTAYVRLRREGFDAMYNEWNKSIQRRDCDLSKIKNHHRW